MLISEYFGDNLIEDMIKVWPTVSKNTFKKLTKMNKNVDGNSKQLIQYLELIHPRIFVKVRARASYHNI